MNHVLKTAPKLRRVFVVDIETMGLPPSREKWTPPVVFQIAIVAMEYQPDGEFKKDVLNLYPNTSESLLKGARVDDSTMRWWRETPEKMKVFEGLVRKPPKMTDWGAVEANIHKFMLDKNFSRDDVIYMRTPHFDQTILAMYINPPWRHNQVVDVNSVERVLDLLNVAIPIEGSVYDHNAVNDALHDGKLMHDGLSAAAEQVPRVWLPISSAPRDGTTILVKFGKYDGVSQAKYCINLTHPWMIIDENDGHWFVNQMTDDRAGPSHWMSIPATK